MMGTSIYTSITFVQRPSLNVLLLEIICLKNILKSISKSYLGKISSERRKLELSNTSIQRKVSKLYLQKDSFDYNILDEGIML